VWRGPSAVAATGSPYGRIAIIRCRVNREVRSAPASFDIDRETLWAYPRRVARSRPFVHARRLAQVDDIVAEIGIALSTSRRQSPDAVPRLGEVFHGSGNETHVSSNRIKQALIS
jgi:hypothetical protein